MNHKEAPIHIQHALEHARYALDTCRQQLHGDLTNRPLFDSVMALARAVSNLTAAERTLRQHTGAYQPTGED